MVLPDQRERAAARSQHIELRQQIHGEIRIRAEAQHARHRFQRRRRCDELQQHIEPAADCVTQDVGVVGAQVVLLHGVVAEPCTGLEIELDHLDVGGQAPLFEHPHVLELRVIAEHAPDEWRDVPALQIR